MAILSNMVQSYIEAVAIGAIHIHIFFYFDLKSAFLHVLHIG